MALHDRNSDPGEAHKNHTYIFSDLTFHKYERKVDQLHSITLALLRADYSPERKCLVIVKAAHNIEDRFRPVVEHLHYESLEKLDFGCWEMNFEVELAPEN